MGLAVGDHLPIRGDPAGIEHVAQHRGRVQAPMPGRIHRVGPVEIDRSGYVPAPQRPAVPARVLLRRTGIEEDDVPVVQPGSNVSRIGYRHTVRVPR